MSIVQDVECVGSLGVIVFYVAYVLLTAELKPAAGLTNIVHELIRLLTPPMLQANTRRGSIQSVS